MINISEFSADLDLAQIRSSSPSYIGVGTEENGDELYLSIYDSNKDRTIFITDYEEDEGEISVYFENQVNGDNWFGWWGNGSDINEAIINSIEEYDNNDVDYFDQEND